MATQTPQQPQVPQAPKVDFAVFRNQQLPPADKPGEVMVGLKVSQVEYAVLKDMVQKMAATIIPHPPDGPAF
jgi:hypothetical protein